MFTSYMPCPTTCFWTSGQRKRLLKRALDFDAVLVMGCESARCTVEQALAGTNCRVILAMQLAGITNAKLKIEFPLNVELDDFSRVAAKERTESVKSAATQ